MGLHGNRGEMFIQLFQHLFEQAHFLLSSQLHTWNKRQFRNLVTPKQVRGMYKKTWFGFCYPAQSERKLQVERHKHDRKPAYKN